MCNIIYIYINVNSKAYLLRLSSFLIYIYTVVHLIYFFFNTVFNSCPFLVHEVFFKVIFTEFLYTGFSFNKQQLPLVFQEQVMFHSKKKVLSDSSEIFCHC
uniref:Uncharacterized protein n=1 Tax=Meleagris gallopavo TaxID=9103 RepID=A0A803Y7R8_MELGA